MNELLIAGTKELEKYIQRKIAEGVGSRVDERARCYFGHSLNLDTEVIDAASKRMKLRDCDT